jgi:regulator of extracellular matrix RemA (YlzA/DUF370 family)
VARLVQVGLGNYVAAERVLGCQPYADVAVQRLVRAARRHGLLLDLTAGRRTRSVLFLDSGHLVLSAIAADTLDQRLRAARQ